MEYVDEGELAGVPLESAGHSGALQHSDVELLQGQPLVQYDGDPLDVDGSPLGDEGDEIVVTPPPPKPQLLPKELPPAARSSRLASASSSDRLFVPSKWETVDPETVESEAVTTASRWELLVDATPKQQTQHESPGRWSSNDGVPLGGEKPWSSVLTAGSNADDLDGEPLTGSIGLVAYDDEDAASPFSDDPTLAQPVVPSKTAASNAAASESRRAILREVELKVVKYQDELEKARRGDKSITEEALDLQVKRYRDRLLERLSVDDAGASSSSPSRRSSDSSSKDVAHKSKSTHRSSHRKSKTESRRAQSPPTSKRDLRDRSPPRSFRDRTRPRRPSPVDANDDNSDERDSSSRESSASRDLSSYELTSDRDTSKRTPSKRRRGSDVEEGEASSGDGGEGVGHRPTSGKLHRSDRKAGSPKSSKKRKRSTTPRSSRRNRQSKSPSPSRRRPESKSKHR